MAKITIDGINLEFEGKLTILEAAKKLQIRIPTQDNRIDLEARLYDNNGKTVQFARRYGGRIALKGNVDCAHTLTFGTEKEVVEAGDQLVDLNRSWKAEHFIGEEKPFRKWTRHA